MIGDSSNSRKNAFIDNLKRVRDQIEKGGKPQKSPLSKPSFLGRKGIQFEDVKEKNDPFLKRYDNPTEPSECLQYDITQRRNEIHKMKQQIDRGIHRDSINAKDYQKII